MLLITLFSDDYRYAFNGMEYDDEIQAGKNSYTTEFRQYDPRLGRWKSLDPLMKMFPSMSPYVGFDNNPVLYTDPYGLAPVGGGEPDMIITREGSWKGDKKNRDIILNSLEQVADGTIIKFVYPNDDRRFEATYTYNQNAGSNGHWYGNYTYDTSSDEFADWNHRATGKDEAWGSKENTGGAPRIVKVDPPTPPVEETTSSTVTTDQTGKKEVTTNKTSKKPGKPIIKKKKTPPSDPPLKIDPPVSVDPPCIDEPIPTAFRPNHDFFNTTSAKKSFLNALKPVLKFMNDNPDEKYHLYIHTNLARGTKLDTDGFFEDNIQDNYENRDISALLYGRYLEVVEKIQFYYPNIKRSNLPWSPVYDSTPQITVRGKNCD